VRRVPDPPSRPSAAADEAARSGSAVPSPAFAFLLALIALPSLFWLVTLKRTTDHTIPEEWLMESVVPPVQAWVALHAPPLDSILIGISGLGSGWFVAIGFGVAGLVALSRRRADLALLLAAGTLAFPIEWALKYFTAIPEISLGQLGDALFNVGNVGLDDLADFPAGHALRATAFYGGITMNWMVRFAYGSKNGISIGFHDLPLYPDGTPMMTEDQFGTPLSGGCVRQPDEKAQWLYGWADIGTVVVVLP